MHDCDIRCLYRIITVRLWGAGCSFCVSHLLVEKTGNFLTSSGAVGSKRTRLDKDNSSEVRVTQGWVCWQTDLSAGLHLPFVWRVRERERERERDPAKHHILWNLISSGCWVVPFGTFIDVSKDFGASFSRSNRLLEYECTDTPNYINKGTAEFPLRLKIRQHCCESLESPVATFSPSSRHWTLRTQWVKLTLKHATKTRRGV
jgi:hypothetical protein